MRAQNHAQNHAQNQNVYHYFFILSSEIAGSIISLITLLDMMHQNVSFTGIHWIEHKVSQWIHNWQLCPLHLQQWMTVSRYFVFLFFFYFWLFLFFKTLITSPFMSICPACRPPDSWTVTFYFANAVEVCPFLFYKHDIKTINRHYASG